jgi:hypothetical protein
LRLLLNHLLRLLILLHLGNERRTENFGPRL